MVFIEILKKWVIFAVLKMSVVQLTFRKCI